MKTCCKDYANCLLNFNKLSLYCNIVQKCTLFGAKVLAFCSQCGSSDNNSSESSIFHFIEKKNISIVTPKYNLHKTTKKKVSLCAASVYSFGLCFFVCMYSQNRRSAVVDYRGSKYLVQGELDAFGRPRSSTISGKNNITINNEFFRNLFHFFVFGFHSKFTDFRQRLFIASSSTWEFHLISMMCSQ